MCCKSLLFLDLFWWQCYHFDFRKRMGFTCIFENDGEKSCKNWLENEFCILPHIWGFLKKINFPRRHEFIAAVKNYGGNKSSNAIFIKIKIISFIGAWRNSCTYNDCIKVPSWKYFLDTFYQRSELTELHMVGSVTLPTTCSDIPSILDNCHFSSQM